MATHSPSGPDGRRPHVGVARFVALLLLIVALAPSAADAFTWDQVNQANSGLAAPAQAFAAAAQKYGAESGESLDALRGIRASVVRARAQTAALTADDDAQRRYLATVDGGFVETLDLIDQTTARNITVADFAVRFGDLSRRLQTRIDATAGGSTTVGSSGGDSSLPFPLDTWWFWVFIGPEAAITALWLISLLVIGPFWMGREGLRRHRKRRSE